MGTAARQGLGKLRHLECHSLWVQQRLRRKDLELRKVNGIENPADLFTKHMDSSAKLDGLVARFGCSFRAGCPDAARKLKRVNCVMTVGEQLPHLLPVAAMNQRHPPQCLLQRPWGRSTKRLRKSSATLCQRSWQDRLAEPSLQHGGSPVRQGRHEQVELPAPWGSACRSHHLRSE